MCYAYRIQLFMYSFVTFIFFFNVDLSEPSLIVNGKKYRFVNISERESLSLSCRVDAKPTPWINISRTSQITTMQRKMSQNVQVSIPEVQCSDTDIYRCTASSPGFVSKHKEVHIDVLCKLQFYVE
jgi:hypothetical protein